MSCALTIYVGKAVRCFLCYSGLRLGLGGDGVFGLFVFGSLTFNPPHMDGQFLWLEIMKKLNLWWFHLSMSFL